MIASTDPKCHDTFITDGGIETHLIFNMDEPLPQFAAFPLNDTPRGRAKIRSYFLDYLPLAQKAGRPFLFATDTWRASPDWGGKLGYDAGALRRNNIAAAELCAELQQEFAAAGVASTLSGVIGPRRDAWQFDAAMTVDEAISYHSPQIEALAIGKVAEIAAYTLTNTAEAIGIARAAERAGLAVALSFTVETDGNLPGGKPLGAAIEEVDGQTGGYPAYYMINCAHTNHFAGQLLSQAPWTRRIGGLRANASTKSHAELDQSPELDAGDAGAFADGHAALLPAIENLRVIGGCCGTDHRHIAALCDRCLAGA